ncbi:MAG: hypothetical protein ACLPSL_12695 [Smithella sp.]
MRLEREHNKIQTVPLPVGNAIMAQMTDALRKPATPAKLDEEDGLI